MLYYEATQKYSRILWTCYIFFEGSKYKETILDSSVASSFLIKPLHYSQISLYRTGSVS
jgi:hypothetical protein